MRFSKSLEKKEKREVDYGISCSLSILLAIGVVMIYSASSYYAMFKYQNSMYFLIRQISWCTAGVIGLFIMSKIDYHKLKK